MKKIKEILINPVSAITRAKKEKNITRTSSLLVLEWVLIGLAITTISRGSLTGVMSALGAFIIGLPSVLFLALLLKIVMTTLGGKGKYFEGLTAVTYGLFVISLGILVSSGLFYLPLSGLLLALMTLSIVSALGIATFYRAVKELFSADMITTWVGIGLTSVGIVLGIYLTFTLLLAGNPNVFQNMLTAGEIV